MVGKSLGIICILALLFLGCEEGDSSNSNPNLANSTDTDTTTSTETDTDTQASQNGSPFPGLNNNPRNPNSNPDNSGSSDTPQASERYDGRYTALWSIKPQAQDAADFTFAQLELQISGGEGTFFVEFDDVDKTVLSGDLLISTKNQISGSVRGTVSGRAATGTLTGGLAGEKLKASYEYTLSGVSYHGNVVASPGVDDLPPQTNTATQTDTTNVDALSTYCKSPGTLKERNCYQVCSSLQQTEDSFNLMALLKRYASPALSVVLSDPEPLNILVQDRTTKRVSTQFIEPNTGVVLSAIYKDENRFEPELFDFGFVGPALLEAFELSTDFAGDTFESTENAQQHICEFIALYDVNVNEAALKVSEFPTMNTFFYRKLIEGARPITSGSDDLASVADGALITFPTMTAATTLWIKGKDFTLPGLLNTQSGSALAKRYEGGSVMVARLAPQDYHRFHMPTSGTIVSVTEVEGEYHSVNPVAIWSPSLSVFSENKRVLVEIESEQIGRYMYVAVGATNTGSVVITQNEGDAVSKGDELGYFAFGGSTVVVVFQQDAVQFDSDLIETSTNSNPVEMLVLMGEKIGTLQ